jgi:hypothetical protein
MLFTSCVGPLALSIAAFRNSLVFHATDQITILAVHFAPNCAIWGMRWWPDELQRTFPGVFELECSGSQLGRIFSGDNCPASFGQLYGLPIFLYVVLWATPYYLFFFVFAKSALKQGGYYTMYEDMVKTNINIQKVVNLGGSSWGEIKYMSFHGVLCYLAFLMGPLLWHSFPLHTVYMLALLCVSTYNGGTYYFRVFAKKYYKAKLLEAAVDIERADQEEVNASKRDQELQLQQLEGDTDHILLPSSDVTMSRTDKA